MRKLKHSEIERPTISEMSSLERFPISILLDDIRSAHNVGSIIRTADAIGAHSVILTGFTPLASHRGVLKTALGAQDVVPWSYASDPVEAAGQLKAEGFTLLALEQTDSPTQIMSLSPSIFPVCIMVGNEVNGLKDDLIHLADHAVEIPQYGIKQSLNVSVATGIAIYRLLQLHLDI